jgi:glucose-1-phosphate cytidylyltransferase
MISRTLTSGLPLLATIPSFARSRAGTELESNGGFVLEPKCWTTSWGTKPGGRGSRSEQRALDGELSAYKHFGFWQPMNTLRDKVLGRSGERCPVS